MRPSCSETARVQSYRERSPTTIEGQAAVAKRKRRSEQLLVKELDSAEALDGEVMTAVRWWRRRRGGVWLSLSLSCLRAADSPPDGGHVDSTFCFKSPTRPTWPSPPPGHRTAHAVAVLRSLVPLRSRIDSVASCGVLPSWPPSAASGSVTARTRRRLPCVPPGIPGSISAACSRTWMRITTSSRSCLLSLTATLSAPRSAAFSLIISNLCILARSLRQRQQPCLQPPPPPPPPPPPRPLLPLPSLLPPCTIASLAIIGRTTSTRACRSLLVALLCCGAGT